MYRKLIEIPSGSEEDIEKDVKRTFPETSEFQEPFSTGQNKLYNILKAYSQYDTKVGYCQGYLLHHLLGMNYIAGILLRYIKDERLAYLCFMHIMYKFNWRRIYLNDMMELVNLILCLTKRLEEQVPAVYKRFKEHEVTLNFIIDQYGRTILIYLLKYIYLLLSHRIRCTHF